MYVSHPVRRVREDPIEGADITLRVTATDERRIDALAERLREVGDLEEHLRFGGLRVTVPQERVDDVCALDDIEAVETANTFTLAGGDAGEDAAYEGEWCRR
ncbi:MAG: hypothetical protein ABEH61_05200 [Haloarculaceae archaeon]